MKIQENVYGNMLNVFFKSSDDPPSFPILKYYLDQFKSYVPSEQHQSRFKNETRACVSIYECPTFETM